MLEVKGTNLLRSEYEKDLIQLWQGCPIAVECQNNQCIFRREQVYGLHCWAAGYKEFYEVCYVKTIEGYMLQTLGSGHSPECANHHDNSIYPSGWGVIERSALRDKLNLEYGPQIVPSIEVALYGTNRWGIKCKDYK